MYCHFLTPLPSSPSFLSLSQINHSTLSKHTTAFFPSCTLMSIINKYRGTEWGQWNISKRKCRVEIHGLYPKTGVDVYGTMRTLTIVKHFWICLTCHRNIKHAQTKNNTDWEKQGAWLFSYSKTLQRSCPWEEQGVVVVGWLSHSLKFSGAAAQNTQQPAEYQITYNLL